MSPVLGSSGILHRSCIGQTYQSVPFSPFWKKQIWTPFLPLQDMDQHWPNQSNLAMANDDTVLEEENLHRFDACFLGHHCKKGWPETWNILTYNYFLWVGWVFCQPVFFGTLQPSGPFKVRSPWGQKADSKPSMFKSPAWRCRLHQEPPWSCSESACCSPSGSSLSLEHAVSCFSLSNIWTGEEWLM